MIKMAEEKETYFGEVVIFFNKEGYGFIAWEKDGVKQKDMFVYYSDIVCEGYKVLFRGQKVSFKLGVNDAGKPKAVEVLVLKN
jgi:cold shock CspA family protein